MTTAIHFNAKVPKGHVLDVADAIAVVLNATYEARSDQETVRAALATLARGATIEGATIANNSIQMGRD